MRRRKAPEEADKRMSSRLHRPILAAVLGLAALLPAGCHRTTEEEALEAAREEVREELRPEVERRQKEIEDLKRQIEEARARLAARKAHPAAAPSP